MLKPTDKQRQTVLWVLTPLLAIAIFMFWYIGHYSVNTPFWDEWELSLIFQHIHSGHLYWMDFWQQHNEHRVFFPTLVLVGMAYVTHWNTQIELVVSLLIAIASFLILARLAVRSFAGRRQTVFMTVLLAAIWFSPGQVENWLWGWQIEWFMNVFGVMLLALGVSRIKRHKLDSGGLALILGGGILAQYSLGNGTLIWPIAIAGLIYLGVRQMEKLGPVVLTGLISTALYYYHYANPPGQPPKSLALHQPLRYLEYVVGYLGRPLSYSHRPALAGGTLLLVIFAGLGGYLLMHRRAVFEGLVPWVMLGLYAIGSAMITGLARLGYGIPEAYSSRYTTISSLLLVAVIMMLWQSREIFKKAAWLRTAVPAGFVLVFCAVLIEWGWGMHAADTQHAKLATIHQCSSVPQPTADCLLLTYPSPAVVTPRLQFIKSVHWGGY